MTRNVVAAMLMLGLAPLAGVAQAEKSRQWDFEVFLEDRPIGEQTFAVSSEGEALRVDIQARFDVDFLFFNAYDYHHRNTEYWQGDCLQSLDAETDDNGTPHRLAGRREGDRFVLRVNGEATTLPGCVMTFAYWNPAILEQSRLLNTQDGRFMPIQVAALGEETLAVAGTPVAAERFRLEAEDLRIDLWYAREDRRWLKLSSLIDNNRLVFQLRHHDGQVALLP